MLPTNIGSGFVYAGAGVGSIAIGAEVLRHESWDKAIFRYVHVRIVYVQADDPHSIVEAGFNNISAADVRQRYSNVRVLTERVVGPVQNYVVVRCIPRRVINRADISAEAYLDSGVTFGYDVEQVGFTLEYSRIASHHELFGTRVTEIY